MWLIFSYGLLYPSTDTAQGHWADWQGVVGGWCNRACHPNSILNKRILWQATQATDDRRQGAVPNI